MASYVNDLKQKSTHYFITGFSIVVGLSWNELIKQSINKFFPLETDVILVRLIYCLAVTLLLILVIKYLPDTTPELNKLPVAVGRV